jgi:hypothetical protein
MSVLLIEMAGAQEQRLSDEMVQRYLMLGLQNMPRLRCEGDRPCAPASPQELANPPLSIAEARAVLQRGILSGAAQHCGLDWRRRNFEPMMAHWRTRMRKTERTMALVGVLHGIMQGQAEGALAARGACTDAGRANIDKQLAFRP